MSILFAALLALTPVTAEQAKQVFPAIDLSDLTDEQRGVFIDVAAEVYNYAGCDSTLARCLDPRIKDPHVLRMAALVHQLVKEGAPAQPIEAVVEKYYLSFAPKTRVNLKTDNCRSSPCGSTWTGRGTFVCARSTSPSLRTRGRASPRSAPSTRAARASSGR
jgi:hypothetical protein